jgi:hypothetical protein
MPSCMFHINTQTKHIKTIEHNCIAMNVLPKTIFQGGIQTRVFRS